MECSWWWWSSSSPPCHDHHHHEPNDMVDHISIWSCSGQFGRQPHLGQTFTNQRGAPGQMKIREDRKSKKKKKKCVFGKKTFTDQRRASGQPRWKLVDGKLRIYVLLAIKPLRTSGGHWARQKLERIQEKNCCTFGNKTFTSRGHWANKDERNVWIHI